MSSESAERTDFEELKEILKEFLHQMDFAYNYRLQKLIFYGDIWCLQNFGKRLTDASFKPYEYGSYSDDVTDALEELAEGGEVEFTIKMKPDGPTREYHSHPEGGKLSSAKKEIIKRIHKETAGASTEELAQFTKQTWLFNNTPEGEPMDFEYYVDNVIFSGQDLENLDTPDEEPLETSDFEALVSSQY